MKKVLIVLLLVAFATPSVAAMTEIDSSGSSIGGVTYKPSKSVIVSFVAAAATYAAGAKHQAGTSGYGTLNTDSNLSEFDCAAGTTTKVTVTDSLTMPTGCQ